MRTDIQGGNTGAIDTAQSVKKSGIGRKDTDEVPGGFSKALSGYEREADTDSQAHTDNKPEDLECEKHNSDVALGKSPKPIIDIRP